MSTLIVWAGCPLSCTVLSPVTPFAALTVTTYTLATGIFGNLATGIFGNVTGTVQPVVLATPPSSGPSWAARTTPAPLLIVT